MTEQELKACRAAFEEWDDSDYGLSFIMREQDQSEIEWQMACIKDAAWQGFYTAWNNREALQGWQDIESAPKNIVILVHYKNRCGKNRIIKARYITKYTEENSSGEEWCDYDEENDTYYDREGWYEEIDNWPDYSHIAFCEGKPDLWMNLPNPPLSKI